MCGISGIVNNNGLYLDKKEIQLMASTQEHRGRDAVGFYISNRVCLAHNRLSIIDPDSRSNQPFKSENGDYVLVYNGEIFNFKALAIYLASKGYHCQTNSDTEVLLRLWMVDGPDAIHKLDGMFAFAIYEKKNNLLWLVRDRVGIKPLYYTQQNGRFHFASEAKALVALPSIESKLNPEGLYEYLCMQAYLPGTTLFYNIHQLPAGHVLKFNINTGNAELNCYWDFPHESIDPNISYNTISEQANHLVNHAVQSWGYADVPVGAYISGGLDSSIVATLLAENLPKANDHIFHTFSSVFKHSNIIDEKEYSDLVAEKIKSQHHSIELATNEILSDHSDLMYVLDYPIAGYSAPYRTLSRQVRQKVKVILTGHGGDELFCGYPKYIGVLLCKAISDARLGKNTSFDKNTLRYISGFEKQIQQILGSSAFADDITILFNSLDRTKYLWQFVHPDIRAGVSENYLQDRLFDLQQRCDGDIVKKSMYLDKKILLPSLLHVEDRTSMIENLESRSPLLSRDLLEFSSSLPYDFMLKNGLKSLMRDLGKLVLPRKVALNERKSGTMYPIMELFDRELIECKQAGLVALDNSKLFIRPAASIMQSDLISKRIQWALWSLGSWISIFEVSL